RGRGDARRDVGRAPHDGGGDARARGVGGARQEAARQGGPRRGDVAPAELPRRARERTMGRGNERRRKRRRTRVVRALRRNRGGVAGVAIALALAAGIALLTPSGRGLVARVVAHLRGVPRVTIPEGFSRFEVASRLASRGICDEHALLAATTDRA